MYLAKNLASEPAAYPLGQGQMLILAAGASCYVPDDTAAKLKKFKELWLMRVKGMKASKIDVERIVERSKPQLDRIPINLLRTLAKRRGISYGRRTTKKDLVEMLEGLMIQYN